MTIDPHATFEAALARIHGFTVDDELADRSGGPSMDTRRAEMLAMFNAYLGVNYDPDKVRQVLDVQDYMHEYQSALLLELQRSEIDARQYAERMNSLTTNAFEICEHVLGESDFAILFGGRPREIGALIDVEEFVRAQGREPDKRA